MTHYQSGRRLEWLARAELQAAVYTVIRAAGSHGPVDLVAWNAERLRLVQVKAAGAVRPADREILTDLSKCVPPGASVELWERDGSGFDVRTFTN